MNCSYCGNEPIKARGLCNKCYQRQKRNGSLCRTTRDPNNIWEHKDGYLVIDLYNKKSEKIAEAYVDKEDYDIVKGHKWCLNSRNYVTTTINKKIQKLHKVLFPEVGRLYHLNGNKLDNRESNLDYYKPKVRQSDYIGVHWNNELGRWKAFIQINKKKHHLGSFVDETSAIQARIKAENKLRRDNDILR